MTHPTRRRTATKRTRATKTTEDNGHLVPNPGEPPKPRTFVVKINEYGKDPTFIVTALSDNEAVSKAVAAFRETYPKDHLDDIKVDRDSDEAIHYVP